MSLNIRKLEIFESDIQQTLINAHELIKKLEECDSNKDQILKDDKEMSDKIIKFIDKFKNELSSRKDINKLTEIFLMFDNAYYIQRKKILDTKGILNWTIFYGMANDINNLWYLESYKGIAKMLMIEFE